MKPMRTAFLFPGINGAGHIGEDLGLLRLPGFAARWQVVTRAFVDAPGFAAFARCLLTGDTLPTTAATWPWRALAVTAMQLAMAEELEQRGEHADWLCGYSIGDVARSCHAGAFGFADVTAFAASLPPLPIVRGATAVVQAASQARLLELQSRFEATGVTCSRLSPRFLMVAGPIARIRRLLAACHEPGVHAQQIAACALHAALQRPVAHVLSTALATRRLATCRAGVFSTLWGRPIGDGDDLRQELAANVISACDFATAIRRLHEQHGVTRFVDLGPGRHGQRFVRHHEVAVESVAARELLTLRAARA